VTDTANPTEWSLAQREALKKGTIKGPRLFVTGVRIDGPATPDESADYIVHVKTPAEARQVARDLLHQGVDLLKVYNNLTPDLLQPIVEEAHKAGTEAVGHSHDANDAIHAGLKFIEHMTPIVHATISDPAKLTALDAGKLPNSDAEMDEQRFPALVELMVKNGVFMNPTLTRTGATPKKPEWNTDVIALLESPEYRFIPQARRDNWLKIANTPARPLDGPRAEGLKKTLDFLRMYARAGGRFITGPDSGPSSGPTNMAGLAMHVEMEALVDAGLTPMQAIMSSTKWPAELLHKDKDLGTVAAGKVADLIVIDGNPLADIRATQKIRTVMMDGKIVDTTLDPNFKNPIPRPLPETR
jgi:imidazolonepropionase-like amidohydrolase